MSDAATETNCFGDTSIKVIWSRGAIRNSPASRDEIRSSAKLPSAFSSAFACAMVFFCSSMAER